MKKSKWIDPYFKNSRGTATPSIRDCWTCAQAGVYLIRHKQSGAVVYIGSSTTQLKKTIYRHFQTWTDKQQSTGRSFERKVYPKFGHYELRFFKCTAAQALKIEKFLIIKHQPKDNPLKYERLSADRIETGKKLYSEAVNSETLPAADYLEDVPF
jgi:hypothetical protein